MSKPPVYDEVFGDLLPPLDEKKALIEASRCYYCYDAPCIQACPTGIDVPSFIRKISNGNTKGAALDILGANIMGGTCARACPVETLCQQACVREKSEHEPVAIGRLQRYATDEFFKRKEQPFKRARSTGHKVAVVGAGPAGLSCAHKLSRLGVEVTVFEARPKPGGLNEYGLAPYKMVGGFAQREVDFILGLGGIEVKHGKELGKDFTLKELVPKYAAVFLGLGLGGTNKLGIPGENFPGVLDAARHIEEIHQAKTLSKLSVGRNVVVIGGGNTAIDISIQMKRLGAELVTLVYRRGEEHMGATWHERELARLSGVLIKTWAKPSKILGDKKGVRAIELECKGRKLELPADQVFKAIGQTLLTEHLTASKIKIAGGKIVTDENFETTVPGIFAGGDCIAAGEDLTVTAVQHGKLAALAIHDKIAGQKAAGGGKNG